MTISGEAVEHRLQSNYAKLAADGNGVFITSRLPQAFGAACGARSGRAALRASGTDVLNYERTLESILYCAVLKQAKSAEIAGHCGGEEDKFLQGMTVFCGFDD